MLPLSFEFFPPKTAEQRDSLRHPAERLKAHSPEYVSCTSGLAIDPELHLRHRGRAQGSRPGGRTASILHGRHSRDEIRELLQRYVAIGCKRIVALRGDMLDMAVAGEFRHAIDLVRFIREFEGHFHIEVAGYPEFHPQARNADDDLRHLVEKVAAGANGVITQYFFNADAYQRFVRDVRALGIQVPPCLASC